MTIGVLLLAAGRSTRFGSDKRQARLSNGERVMDYTLSRILESGLPLRVCVDVGDSELAGHLERKSIVVFRCHHAADGMGATLAEGVTKLPDWDGVLVALADMPWIAACTYQRIAESLDPASICVPVYDGNRGHPVGFGRQFWRELAGLKGDIGARALLEKHRDALVEIPDQDPAILRDIDQPSDIR